MTAVALKPDYAPAQLGLARLQAANNNIDDASRLIDAVIAANPKAAEAYAMQADLRLFRGDRAGAKTSFEQAVAADGSFLPARYRADSVSGQRKTIRRSGRPTRCRTIVAQCDLRTAVLSTQLSRLARTTSSRRATWRSLCLNARRNTYRAWCWRERSNCKQGRRQPPKATCAKPLRSRRSMRARAGCWYAPISVPISRPRRWSRSNRCLAPAAAAIHSYFCWREKPTWRMET